MLKISKIRGNDLEIKFLPRFFFRTFCALRLQYVIVQEMQGFIEKYYPTVWVFLHEP